MLDDDVLDGDELENEGDLEQETPVGDAPPTEEPPESDDQRLSRKERRAQRGRNLVAESKRRAHEAEQRLLDEQRRSMELERRLNDLESRVTSGQKKEEEDDVDRQLQANYNKRIQLARTYYRGDGDQPLTETERAELIREQAKLDDEQYQLRYKKFGAPQQQQQQQTQEPPEVQGIKQRYFDVLAHPAATNWATGRMQSAVSEREFETGIKPTGTELIHMLDGVMDEARDRFKIGKRGQATDATRRKYSGQSGDYPTRKPNQGPAGQLSQTEKAMARQFYEDKIANGEEKEMDEDTMYRRFAKEVKGG